MARIGCELEVSLGFAQVTLFKLKGGVARNGICVNDIFLRLYSYLSRPWLVRRTEAVSEKR